MSEATRRPYDPIFGLAVIALAVVVVTGLSVLQGAYHLDPHHWGLILSNAIDLDRGRVPYKEVFIQYGFLTAVLVTGFYKIGGTQLSIMAGVSAFYAAGIAGTYFISLQISAKRRLAVYTVLTALLVHPLAIHPWPNYLAYPFIVFGCLCVMKGERSPWLGLLGGVLLSLAVLCREGLFLAIAIALLALPVLEYWCSGDARRAVLRLTSWCGFAVPLGLFALYLGLNGLWDYWWKTAVELPKLYSQIFFYQGIAAAAQKLLIYVLPYAPLTNPQQFVIGLVLLAAVYFCLLGIVRTEARRIGSGTLFLAALTGLLTSSSIHINEIFRLSTSVLAGTALLYVMADRFRGATPVFSFCAIFLVAGFFLGHVGNYFLPTRHQIEIGMAGSRPVVFAGQRWTPDVYAYYDWYDARMRELDARGCGLKYIRNETLDAYLEAFSPFMQYQMMPFGRGIFYPQGKMSLDAWSRQLRPDYDLEARLRNRDIVVVTSRSPNTKDAVAPMDDRVLWTGIAETSVPSDPVPPKGFVEFSSRVAPRSFFMPEGLVTLLWVPDNCISPNGEPPSEGQP